MHNHYRKILIGALICFMISGIQAADYYRTAAKNGDGPYSLLKRYLLYNDCNLEEFYKINKLEGHSQILAGVKYNLPVYIIKYNGQSIRSTLGIKDYDKAKRIEKYNEDIRARGLRRMTIQSSKILWVPFHEMYCMAEKIDVEAPKSKTSKHTKVNSVFGPKYNEFTVKSNKLKNHVYYIVSGHGGPDIGANCHKGGHMLCEDEYAYDVSLRLAKNLMEQGAVVEIIIKDPNDGIRDYEILKKDHDERCYGQKLPRNQTARLKQRTDAINKLYLKYRKKGYVHHKVISIHVDSQDESRRQDVYFFVGKNSSRKSRTMAQNLLNTFESKYAYYQKNRGYKGSVRTKNFYILRETMPPAVLVELANIKNHKDHKRILNPSNRQYLAQWLYEGLIK